MAQSQRILVVDDEVDTLGLIDLTLATAGYEVQTAASGEQALQILKETSFELILLDLMMPDLSGFDVLRRMRSEEIPIPPVIILTARNQPEDRETGEEMGVASYLIKPTTRGDLLDAVGKALSPETNSDAPD